MLKGPGVHLSPDVLRNDVWHEMRTEKNTIHRVVRNLRRRLRDKGLVGAPLLPPQTPP